MKIISEKLLQIFKSSKNTISFFYYLYHFVKGFILFKTHQNTPPESYQALRKLYVLSNGRFNDFISYLLSIKSPKYKNIGYQFKAGQLAR